MAPIDGENISEQCRNDSQKYIDILNSVSKNLDLFMILWYKNIYIKIVFVTFYKNKHF